MSLIVWCLYFWNLDDFVYQISVASDWQGIISGSTWPKAVVLSLVDHRITGSKQSVKLLHRTEANNISYTDVLKQIKRFFFDTQNSSNLVLKSIPKGQLTRAIIENSNGRQQTLIGFAIAHHAHTTIYIPKIQSLSDTTNCLENETIKTPLVTRNIVDYEEYKIGEPPEPSFVKEYKDVHRDSVEQSLLVDCAMSASAALTS